MLVLSIFNIPIIYYLNIKWRLIIQNMSDPFATKPPKWYISQPEKDLYYIVSS